MPGVTFAALKENARNAVSLLREELRGDGDQRRDDKLARVAVLVEEDEQSAAALWGEIRCDCDSSTQKRRDYIGAIVVCVDATFRNLELHRTGRATEPPIDLNAESLLRIAVAISEPMPDRARRASGDACRGTWLRRAILCGLGLVILCFGAFVLIAPAPGDTPQTYAKLASGVVLGVGGMILAAWSLLASDARIQNDFQKMWDRL